MFIYQIANSGPRSDPASVRTRATLWLVCSLRGLHDCLKARGEVAEQAQIKQRLDLALARADRAVAASCFCAQAAMRAS